MSTTRSIRYAANTDAEVVPFIDIPSNQQARFIPARLRDTLRGYRISLRPIV